jgi:hypothetical protein
MTITNQTSRIQTSRIQTSTIAASTIHADHGTARRLGDWTTDGHLHVRARSGSVLLDLRSPGLPDEIEVRVELSRAVVKLLVPEDAVVDHWDLDWTGRGKVKDNEGMHTAETGGRRIRLIGTVADGEIRVNRGGTAILFAMCSREGFAELRRAHKAGVVPSIVDNRR